PGQSRGDQFIEARKGVRIDAGIVTQRAGQRRKGLRGRSPGQRVGHRRQRIAQRAVEGRRGRRKGRGQARQVFTRQPAHGRGHTPVGQRRVELGQQAREGAGGQQAHRSFFASLLSIAQQGGREHARR